MRLVVHIGAATAAAGFLQRCLFLNEDVLRREGVHVPATGRLDPSYETVAHHNLGWELLGDRSFQESGGTWADLLAELATVDADTVLLTSETFGRLASDPQLASTLGAELSRLSDDVTLVYVVRDPLESINALFLQSVKDLGTPSSFDDYAAASVKSGYHDLDESFRTWYTADGVRLLALRYDELAASGPLETLLSAIDVAIPRDRLTIPHQSDHPPPGPIAVEAMRAINVHLRVIDPGFSRRSPAATRVARMAERRASKQGWYDDQYWGWTPEQAEWAAGRLAAANHAFARAVWGTDWPVPTVTDRPQEVVNIIDSDRLVYNEVLDYVAVLTQRYLKLSAGAPSDDPASDVVTASTALTDEGERAVGTPARKPPGRAAASLT